MNLLKWQTYFCRYEDEINKRAAVENEFVLLKKVIPLAAFLAPWLYFYNYFDCRVHPLY